MIHCRRRAFGFAVPVARSVLVSSAPHFRPECSPEDEQHHATNGETAGGNLPVRHGPLLFAHLAAGFVEPGLDLNAPLPLGGVG